MSQPAVEAVLTGMWRLVVSHEPGSHEGPGSLVDGSTWHDLMRRLADVVLAGAASDEPYELGAMSEDAQRAARALYGPGQLLVAPCAGPTERAWAGKLVFVLGVGRSGTTWLQRMLQSSPECGGPEGEESMLFKACEGLWNARRVFEDVCDEERLIGGLAELADRAFGEALGRVSPGAHWFVEKTPRHSILLPMIKRIYPDAHFIHVVRDGRDVARSMTEISFFNVATLEHGARLWRTVLEHVGAEGPTLQHFRRVRYEALLSDPVPAVADLLRWIGAAVDDDVLTELAGRSGARVSTHAGTAQPVGADTWKHLPASELARVYVEIGRHLVAEGYATRWEVLLRTSSPRSWGYRWQVSRLRRELRRLF